MVAVSSQRVQIAGSQSAQAAVAETCVRLLLIDGVDGDAEILEHAHRLVHHLQVVDAGLEASAHEEFHRKVVHLLLALRAVLNCKMSSLSLKDTHHDLSQRLIYLLVGSLVGVSLKIVVQHVNELCLQLLFRDSL